MRRRCTGGSRRCGTVRAGVSCSAELVAAESAATRRGRYASQIDVAPRDESRGRGHAPSVSAAPEAVNTGCAVRGEAPGSGADGGHTTALQPPTWPLNCAVISSRRGARRSAGTRRRAPGGPSDFIRPQCGGEAATGAAQNRPTGTGEPGGAVGTSLPQAATEWGPTGTWPRAVEWKSMPDRMVGAVRRAGSRRQHHDGQDPHRRRRPAPPPDRGGGTHGGRRRALRPGACS